MSGLSFVKAVLPIALKQPVGNFLERRALKGQHRLPFDPRNLRSGADVDIKTIMNDGRIRATYASDLDKLRPFLSSEEISGGVNPGDRRAIYHLVSAWRPMRVLEIGTHIGASTTSIALAQSHFGGALTTVDVIDVNAPDGPWRRLDLPRPPEDTLASLGLAKVEFVRGKALNVFRRRDGLQYDLVFLDGDHSTLAVYREIDAALCVLAPNGLILLHDFYPGCRPITPDGAVIKGPAIAAARIEGETSALTFLPLGELPWPTKGGGNATSLALVVKS